ncbi:MAG: hypothetical protein KC933_12550 [Myxococcales bacterium]|nr:hypothetical protein [Myxococcales bacterium]MCB9649291.1 hypothetical protein [Deltaproteobacteria bacterium]
MIWLTSVLGAPPPAYASLNAQLVTALDQRNALSLAAMFDGQALGQAILPSPDAPAVLFEVFGTSPARRCAELIVASIPAKSTGPVQLRRVRDGKGPEGPTLRYLVERDGRLVEALEFWVSGVRGVDLLVDGSASVDGRRCASTLLREVVESRPALAERLPSAGRIWAQHLSALGAIRAARGPADAIRRYEALPPEVQGDPEVAMATLEAAMTFMDERPFTTLQSILQSRFPNDAGFMLRLFDHHALRQDPSGPPAALEAANNLAQELGPDPALDELICVYGRSGWMDRRVLEKLAQRALRNDPERVQARVTLFNLKMNKGDFANAVKLLNHLRRGLPREDYLALLSAHPDLLQSLEYRHWQRFISDEGR